MKKTVFYWDPAPHYPEVRIPKRSAARYSGTLIEKSLCKLKYSKLRVHCNAHVQAHDLHHVTLATALDILFFLLKIANPTVPLITHLVSDCRCLVPNKNTPL